MFYNNQIVYFATLHPTVRHKGSIQLGEAANMMTYGYVKRKKRSIIIKTMICEIDYEQITIKAWAERAQISRKTFYLHYTSLD